MADIFKFSAYVGKIFIYLFIFLHFVVFHLKYVCFIAETYELNVYFVVVFSVNRCFLGWFFYRFWHVFSFFYL